MTNTEGQGTLFTRIAARFPLLPRSRPPAQTLPHRVHEISDLVESAKQERDEGRAATLASEALNKTALIASDCGLSVLARVLCWRQFTIFHNAAPLVGQDSTMALQPLVNLGRLATREGDGDRAYTIFHSIFDAVTKQTARIIDDREINFSDFATTSEQYLALRRSAWSVLLAEGTRALTRAGRWADAVQYLQRYRGIGARLLDGRQTAILLHASEGDYDAALGMIQDSAAPEPWERAVASSLRVLCLRLDGHSADTEAEAMVSTYLQLPSPPEFPVFRTRLGLCVIDLVADLDRAAAQRVIEQVDKEVLASVDAHVVQDVLEHEPCRAALSKQDIATLAATMEASGLSCGSMPSHLLDTLLTSAQAGEDRLSAALATRARLRRLSAPPSGTKPPSSSSTLAAPKGPLPVHYAEVEKKFEVADPAELKAALEQLGATPSEPVRQVDVYYNAPHRDFLAGGAVSDWLRIRIDDHGSWLNFKRWHPVEDVVKSHAEEYETRVDDVEAVRLILDVLDFSHLVTVDKTREHYRLPEVEVVFDHVLGAGRFVEFEFKGEADSIDDATEQLEQFIASLKVELGEPVNRGYPHIILNRAY